MSEENLQATRRMLDAFNSGDVDGWVQGLHPDVVWVPIPEYTETEAIRGPGPVREFVAASYRDGKGIEFRWFMNEADALETAGIEDRPAG